MEDQEAMVVDKNAQPADAPNKNRVKKIEVPFTPFGPSLDSSVLEKLIEQEAQMHTTDKLVHDTEVRRSFTSAYTHHHSLL